MVLAATVPTASRLAAGPDAPSVLELHGLGKRFGGFTALDGVGLSVEPGEVHCLLGENGAGKSTLCNLVFGVHAPSAGEMLLGGRAYRPGGPVDALEAGIAMVHQHFSLVGPMTVTENVMLGSARGRLAPSRAADEISRLAGRYGFALDPARLVRELSVGERQRVEIVKCLMREPRLLVLDEPTAVLPPDEVEALLTVVRQIAAGGRGVLLVTHKLAEIARIADRVTVLRGGRAVLTRGVQGSDMRELVRAMVGREVAAIGSGAAAALGLVEAAAEEAAMPSRHDREEGRGEAALLVDGLLVRDREGVARVDGLTLEVAPGEIVGLAGVEGNGQSELGTVLAGLLRPAGGRWFVGGRELTLASPRAIIAAGVGIVPEDRHATAVITAMSVAENLALGIVPRASALGFLDRRGMRGRAAKLMAEFDVRANGPDTPMASLSGGNQQKAVLARELTLAGLRFLLAAQPTRGLDIGAVEAVYTQIRAAAERGVGVLLISSELDELIAVSSRILVIYRGRIVGECAAHPSERERIGGLMSGHGS